MEIGVIGWAANSGMGICVQNLLKHLPITRWLAVPHPSKGFREDWINKDLDIVAVAKHPLTEDIVKEFLKGLDLLVVFESPLFHGTYSLCRQMGVKTLVIPMWEWTYWDEWEKVDWFWAPTECCEKLFRSMDIRRVDYIPWPVDTDVFSFRERRENNLFLHNAGWLGVGGRKGTDELIEALIDTELDLFIRTQTEIYESIYSYAKITVEEANTNNPADCYRIGDVAIQPSKWEGIGLTIQESMACGLPCITTDAPPMNEYFPVEMLLIKAKKERPRRLENPSAPVYLVDKDDLYKKCKNLWKCDISELSEQARNIIEEKYSWKAQKGKILDLLDEVGKGKKGRTVVSVDDLSAGNWPFKVKEEV